MGHPLPRLVPAPLPPSGMRIPQIVSSLLLLGGLATGLTAQAPLNTQPAPASWLQSLDASAATVQTLSPNLTGTAPNEQLSFQVELGGTVETITLRKRDIRAPGYQLLIDDGVTIQAIEPGPVETWVGEIDGDVGSNAAVTFRNDTIQGVIRRSGGTELFGIQPVFELVAGAANDLHFVHNSADAVSHGETCGVTATATGPAPANTPRTGEDMLRIAEIAIEGDFTLYQQFGSSATATENAILTVLNNVNVIYERDTDIRHEVSATLIRTSTDPYTTNSASSLLTQFRNWWNANRGGTPRDVTHLFTGRNLSGSTIGIARLASVCNRTTAYGLSQLTFSGNISRRTGLTAHELGHCWSAVHCDGDSDCRIMCAGLGGCANNLTAFGTRSIGLIRGWANSSSCLSSGAPTISSISPITVPTFGSTQAQINGTAFTGVTRVEVGGRTLATSQYTVVSDTRIDFFPGTPAALGVEAVVVTTNGGTSAPRSFLRVSNNPAILDGPSPWFGGFNLLIQGGSRENRSVFLIANVDDPGLIPFFGLNLISNPVLLQSGTSDALGLVNFTLPTPFGISGIDLRLQLLDLNVTSTLLETASAPLVIQFL